MLNQAQWLADARRVLALPQPSMGSIRAMLHEHHDDETASVYGYSIWCAYEYLKRHKSAFDDAGLLVAGVGRLVARDCLLIALYEPFMSASILDKAQTDPAPDLIAEKARAVEKSAAP